jgi:enamine deaminase RidA (YjgF/YER057c/UK114 family)
MAVAEAADQTSLGRPLMLRRITPATIHPPFANYCHATLVPSTARWLCISGQLGIRPDGVIPERFEHQAEACFDNIAQILAEAGMQPADLVRLNTYLTDSADLATYMMVRDRYVGDPPPASTLMVVQALARPQFRIEIEATAAA